MEKIISLGGINEISRCKSWNFVEYKSFREIWFMLFFVGCVGASIMGKDGCEGLLSVLNKNKYKSVRSGALKTISLLARLAEYRSDTPINAIKTKDDIKKYDFLMGQFIKTRDVKSEKPIIYKKGERYIKGVSSRVFMLSPILGAIILLKEKVWPGSAPYFCKYDDIRTTNFVGLIYKNFEEICHDSNLLQGSAPAKIGLEAIKYDENRPYFFVGMPKLA